jgi:hypothetical protein
MKNRSLHDVRIEDCTIVASLEGLKPMAYGDLLCVTFERAVGYFKEDLVLVGDGVAGVAGLIRYMGYPHDSLSEPTDSPFQVDFLIDFAGTPRYVVRHGPDVET